MPRTRKQGRPKKWTRDKILAAGRQWKADHDGELPRIVDFSQNLLYPSFMTCIREFGSWSRYLGKL